MNTPKPAPYVVEDRYLTASGWHVHARHYYADRAAGLFGFDALLRVQPEVYASGEWRLVLRERVT